MHEREEALIVAVSILTVFTIALGALAASPAQCCYTDERLAKDLANLPFLQLVSESKEKEPVKNTVVPAALMQQQPAKNIPQKKVKEYGLIRTCYYGAIKKIKQFYTFIY